MPGLIGKPPNDSELPQVTWTWLDKLRKWLRADANVTPSQMSSITLSDDFLYPYDATSGNLVPTLPLASTCPAKKYCIKKTDSSTNTVTVTRSGSDTIDGNTTVALSTQYEELEVVSDGVSKWHITGHWINAGSGSSIGGTDKMVQYNKTGFLAGDANFEWDYTNLRLVVGPQPASAINAQVTAISAASFGALAMSSNRGDADATEFGRFVAVDGNSTLANKNLASIGFFTDGTTATQRGGAITFNTHADSVSGLSERMRVTGKGDIFLGVRGNVYPTNMTQGWPWIPTVGGAFSGTPADSTTGMSPIGIDTTNSRMMAYFGGVWHNLGFAGGGGGLTAGTTTVNFGSITAPTAGSGVGSPVGEISVTITGQTTISASSNIKAYILPVATSDHSADEHRIESFKVDVGNVVAGTGFDIFVESILGGTYGSWTVGWEWE